MNDLLEIADCFEFMPDSSGKHSQSELSKIFLKNEIKDSVTFFGGSFNPFHRGHLECLNQCPEKNILIVPDRNPFKPLNDNTNFLKLAEDLKDTRYNIYPGFLAMKESNPTSRWLPFVKLKEKNFLLGDDSYMALHTWKNPEAIIKSLTKLYVVPRLHTKEDYLKQELVLKKWKPDLDVIYLADHPYKNLSSTSLRK